MIDMSGIREALHIRAYNNMLITRALGQINASPVSQRQANRFLHWVPSKISPPRATDKESWWIQNDGDVRMIFGNDTEALYFAYPVSGEFEFTADCSNAGWSECDVGFNGILPELQNYSESFVIRTLSQNQRLNRQVAMKGTRPGYGRVRISSDGEVVRFSLNIILPMKNLSALHRLGSPCLLAVIVLALIAIFVLRRSLPFSNR